MLKMFDYLVISWAGILGLLLGGAMSRAISRKLINEARQKASSVVEEARQGRDAIMQEGETRAREEALKVRKLSESRERQSTEENALLEERLPKLEARIEKREADIAIRQDEQDRTLAQIQQLKGEARSLKQEAKDQRRAHLVGLEERAEETSQQLKAHMTDSLIVETRAQCADRLRNLEAEESHELDRRAKRLIGIAMGRFSKHFLSSRMSSNIALTEDGAARLTGDNGYLEDIEQQVGVHLEISESKDSVRLEGGSGTSRELARRVVSRFISEKRIKDHLGLIASVTADLEREIQETGKKAFLELGLKPAHPEIVKLLGRLNFRTSYTQNQWQHSIESAFLAGMIAAELGMDEKLARRATLIHDIGKALTHEREGSHALISAEYAREYGESDLIANAVGSHHGDESQDSPYANLVAASDAMSGARPGARREMIETYVDRISDLEKIAAGFPGVVAVHAVQAGRELRIHVDEHKVDDDRSATLSEKIADKISSALTFPGQIRVTVIREFKAMETAR